MGSTIRSLILAGAAGIALAALLAYFLARRLSRPLHRLAQATVEVAAGREDVRVPVEGEDELAALASSFNRMADGLDEARRAGRTFLMSVSHELKTPLAAIRGYGEALEDGVSDGPEAGEVISREADRLDRLVRDLLDLARLDARRFSVVEEEVDLPEVADAGARRYRQQAEEFGVELSAELDSPGKVIADRDRLLQVLSNLLENALRATPAGGRVLIRSGPGELVVEDTGPGLAPEDIPQAFERFYLHERYASDRSVGSGLGLALVKELTEAMGGSVSVRSRPGEGTAFSVHLRQATSES